MVSVSHPCLQWVITIALARAGLCPVCAVDAGHTAELIQLDLIFADARARRLSHPPRRRCGTHCDATGPVITGEICFSPPASWYTLSRTIKRPFRAYYRPRT